MAVLARRTWDELRDEVIRRCGRVGDSAFTALAERFVEAAYYDLAYTFHHYELDKISTTGVLNTSQDFLAVPADLWINFALWIGDPSTNAFVAALVWEPPSSLLRRRSTTAAQPAKYTRFGDQLIFPANPDLAYKTTHYYYQIPTAPDFTTGSPVIDRVWDEHIIEGAVAKATRANWDPQSSGMQGELLSEFLATNPQPPLSEGGNIPQPQQAKVSKPYGGSQ